MKNRKSLKNFVGKKGGLYIHVPFCKQKCSYCSFYSKTSLDDKDKYINKLIQDIKLLPKHFVYDTIYFGGGTPSILDLREFESIFSNIILNNIDEITVEVNPESIDLEYLKGLKKIGVNRVSIGIQSLNNDILNIFNRLHNREIALEQLDNIKNIFNNFSVDFIIGINELKTEEIVNQIRFVVDSFSPTHISVYGLSLDKDVLLYKNGYKLDSEKFYQDYLAVCEMLKDYGYIHYEVSNFAKDNSFSKHNSKYWLMNDYIGLGPNAHSFINRQRFAFDDLDSYFFNSIDDLEKENIDKNEYKFEKKMLSLRTIEGLFIDEIDNISNIEDYINMGYIQQIDNRVVCTEKGFMVLNSLINNLIEM